MATNLSAEKRQRQNEKIRLHNKHYKTLLKNEIKKLTVAIEQKKKKEAVSMLKSTIKTISRVKGKGIVHANNAARKISRLTKLVNSL